MSFKIKNIETGSIIEIISMNIDDEHNVLVLQDEELEILKIGDFKDMILGTVGNTNAKAKGRTHEFQR